MGSAFFVFIRRVLPLFVACVLSLGNSFSAFAAIEISSFGTPYAQDFDILANSGSTGSTLPTGWTFLESGGSAPTTYGIGSGTSGTGNTYSFGTGSETDRAFGTIASGTISVLRVGAEFENSTGGTITSLLIEFYGEQWRFGGNSTNRPGGTADILNFQYSLDANDSALATASTGLNDSATWIDVDALDFSSQVSTGSSSTELDGNDAQNRLAISATISTLSIPNGATFWIRWRDTDIGGSDDGLAIDDFSLTANGTLPPTGVVPEASAFLVWSLLCGSVLMGWKRVRDF